MKIEIECEACDFRTEANWPELFPEHLDHLAHVGKNTTDDPGLRALCTHHAITRPKIAEREGLASGHYNFSFKINDEPQNKKITVSGEVAFLE